MTEECPTCLYLQSEQSIKDGISCILHTNPNPEKYYCHCDGTGFPLDDEGNEVYFEL